MIKTSMTLQASQITLRIDFQSSFLQHSHTSFFYKPVGLFIIIR